MIKQTILILKQSIYHLMMEMFQAPFSQIIYSSRACSNANYFNNRSKKDSNDQKSTQSSTTHDPGYQWERNKLTIRHHKREPRGQPYPSR